MEKYLKKVDFGISCGKMIIPDILTYNFFECTITYKNLQKYTKTFKNLQKISTKSNIYYLCHYDKIIQIC